MPSCGGTAAIDDIKAPFSVQVRRLCKGNAYAFVFRFYKKISCRKTISMLYQCVIIDGGSYKASVVMCKRFKYYKKFKFPCYTKTAPVSDW